MPFEAGGLWYSAIVKERRDARGQHIGYEGIQFPVSRILDWWSRNRLPSGSSSTLLSRDGRIWLRDPFVPTLIGADAAGDPFAGAVGADAKHLSRIVDYDGGGVDAIVGWRSLEAFGLIYAVGIDRAQMPAPSGASATLSIDPRPCR